MSGPLVAFVHATPLSMQPLIDAFAREFPEAEPWHLLDDRLARDADDAGGLTPALRGRMLSLIRHAVDGGAAAVQLSCSMYGPVTRLARQLWELPVHGSDDAMFAEFARLRPARAGVLSSLGSAAADSVHRLTVSLDGGVRTELLPIPVPAALDPARRDTALLEAAKEHDVDLFVLAQYSISPAQQGLETALGVPVLSPPRLAARALRAAMRGEARP
ncbi:hypothetical protein [Prauserella flavalba]|uniref:hypothetical protein n=1 Tax=Prauserella flavalba TaxID=1477506 RepID=UPI0036E4D897